MSRNKIIGIILIITAICDVLLYFPFYKENADQIDLFLFADFSMPLHWYVELSMSYVTGAVLSFIISITTTDIRLKRISKAIGLLFVSMFVLFWLFHATVSMFPSLFFTVMYCIFALDRRFRGVRDILYSALKPK